MFKLPLIKNSNLFKWKGNFVEKIEKKLDGWKGKLISRGGRLQLVNSVLSSIPIYFMACFQLPRWVLKRIDMIRRQFLWGKTDGSVNGTSLMNWDTVCLPKHYWEELCVRATGGQWHYATPKHLSQRCTPHNSHTEARPWPIVEFTIHWCKGSNHVEMGEHWTLLGKVSL